jgi:hypothetical protein
MKHICNCPFIGIHETWCNTNLSTIDLQKTKCPNCNRTIYEDEIIKAQIGIGENTHHEIQCEYCVED